MDGLFNLQKKMVISSPQGNELPYKLGMLKGKKVGGLADEDQNQLVNKPSRISHTKFYSRDWLTQSIIYYSQTH